MPSIRAATVIVLFLSAVQGSVADTIRRLDVDHPEVKWEPADRSRSRAADPQAESAVRFSIVGSLRVEDERIVVAGELLNPLDRPASLLVFANQPREPFVLSLRQVPPGVRWRTDLPPRPAEAPPPPVMLVLPARTLLELRAAFDTSRLSYRGSPRVDLDWHFSFLRRPAEGGRLSAELPRHWPGFLQVAISLRDQHGNQRAARSISASGKVEGSHLSDSPGGPFAAFGTETARAESMNEIAGMVPGLPSPGAEPSAVRTGGGVELAITGEDGVMKRYFSPSGKTFSDPALSRLEAILKSYSAGQW